MRMIYALIGLTLVSSTRAQTEVPNTFQSGTPARASDVNANFDTLESAIDSNSANIAANSVTIGSIETLAQNNALAISQIGGGSGVGVFDQSGVEIGKFVTLRRINAFDPIFYVLSDQGIIFTVHAGGDATEYLEGANVYFTGLDCSGNAYVNKAGWLDGWALWTGVAAKTGPASDPAYFVTHRGGTIETVFYMSVRYPDNSVTSNNNLGISGCYNQSGTVNAFLAEANIEATTGVSNIAPNGPFKLGVP